MERYECLHSKFLFYLEGNVKKRIRYSCLQTTPISIYAHATSASDSDVVNGAGLAL